MPAPVQEDELWLVTSEGEIVGRQPSLPEALTRVMELQGNLEDIELDLRGKRSTITKLRSALYGRSEYERLAEVQEIFNEWRTECGHKKARLTNDRFDAIRALLDITEPAPYPREAFSAAIAGAKFDPFITTRKNGSQERHDDIALICKSGKTFEGFIKRAPRPDKENV